MNTSLHIILEWQFSALLLSVLFIVSLRFIKNPIIKHRHLQLNFIILFVLPFLCYLIKTSSLCFFSFFTRNRGLTDSLVLHNSPAQSTVTLSPAVTLEGVVLSIFLIYAVFIFGKYAFEYFMLKTYCSKLKFFRSFYGHDVYISKENYPPFCFGILNPIIAIPETALNDSDEQEAILRHEKAHIDNGDHAFANIQYIVKMLYILNPFVYYLDKQFNEIQEILADSYASEKLGNSEKYAQILMNLVKRSQSAAVIPKFASGMAVPKEQLKTRLNAIIKGSINMKKSIPFRKKSSLILFALLTSGAVLTTNLVADEQTQDLDKEIKKVEKELKTVEKELKQLKNRKKPKFKVISLTDTDLVNLGLEEDETLKVSTSSIIDSLNTDITTNTDMENYFVVGKATTSITSEISQISQIPEISQMVSEAVTKAVKNADLNKGFSSAFSYKVLSEKDASNILESIKAEHPELDIAIDGKNIKAKHQKFNIVIDGNNVRVNGK